MKFTGCQRAIKRFITRDGYGNGCKDGRFAKLRDEYHTTCPHLNTLDAHFLRKVLMRRT